MRFHLLPNIVLLLLASGLCLAQTEAVPDFADVSLTIQAIEDEAERAEAWGQTGMIYHARHLPDMAVKAYTFAIETLDDPRWRYLRGIAHREQGNLASATTDFRRVTVLDPTYMPAWYRLGAGLLVAGDVEGASKAIKEAETLAPDTALVLMGLSDVASAYGDWQLALKYLERAIELAPEAGQLAYKLAITHRRLGQVSEARRWLDIRGDRNTIPEIDDPWLLLVARLSQSARFYARAGEWALDRGDYQRARDAYQQAVEFDPDSEQLSAAYIYVLSELGQKGDALLEANRYLLRHPESPAVLYGKAWLLRLEMKSLATAIEAAASALIWDDSTKVRTLLAGLLIKSGDLESAEREYRVLSRRQPDQPYYQYWLGIAQIAQGRCEARNHVQAAIGLRPSWGEAHRLLARIDAICGRGRIALERANALLRADDSSEARITVAFAELSMGQVDAARDRAINLLPHPDAQLLISAIDSGNLPMPYAPGSEAWLPPEVRKVRDDKE